MNTNRIVGLFSVLVIAAFVAVSSVAQAQGRHGGKRGHDGQRLEKLAEKLDLSEQQKQQIKALHERFRQEHEDEFAQMKRLREQMKEARQAGDRERAVALREQMKALHENMKADREALHERMLQILTPEQRAELAEMKERRKDRRKERCHDKDDDRNERMERGERGNRQRTAPQHDLD